ncbi:hypothetical protein HID58_057111 [Brassica napus]|nr:hypothetical protein HID58_057111 [Brassica napus]
MYLGFL